MEESSFKQHIQNKDINSAFNTWLEVLRRVSDQHAPWKQFRRGNNHDHIPWFNRELKAVTEKKNMYLKL